MDLRNKIILDFISDRVDKFTKWSEGTKNRNHIYKWIELLCREISLNYFAVITVDRQSVRGPEKPSVPY